MKPLEGIKVVELSTMLAGPMTARLLAEWGADVIKVESMNGDPWRKQYGTSLSPYTEHANPNFDMQNINKRFVAFNMRTPEGKEAMMKLLATADVFLTNYRVQALEQMGLTYDQLKDQFPKLVHASVLGYGSVPYLSRRVFWPQAHIRCLYNGKTGSESFGLCQSSSVRQGKE